MDIRLESLLPKGATTSKVPNLVKSVENFSGSPMKALGTSGAGVSLASDVYGLAKSFFNDSYPSISPGATSEEKQEIVKSRRKQSENSAKSAVSSAFGIISTLIPLLLL